MLKEFFEYVPVRLDMAYHISSGHRYAHTEGTIVSELRHGIYLCVVCWLHGMRCAYRCSFSPAIGAVNFLFYHPFLPK